jgi:hypothetical protein
MDSFGSPAPRPQRTGRTRRVEMRVSEEEYAALDAKAKAADISMSELLRDHFGKVSIRDRGNERQRNAMLNKLNANLNQIAKWVNTWKDRADAFRVTARLDAVQDEVMRLIEAWEEQAGDRGILQIRQGQRPARR